MSDRVAELSGPSMNSRMPDDAQGYATKMKSPALVGVGCVLVAGCGQSDLSKTAAVDSRVSTSPTKMLAPEVTEEIATLVRSAFYDKERLIEIFCEEMYAPGELDPAAIFAAIDAELAKWESEKKTWPEITDCDRLDSAFAVTAYPLAGKQLKAFRRRRRRRGP